ncbi:MAG: 3-oxoacyl-[acyl-carrier-protein] synthase-3 [Verrucomicrobiales bacterium]|jgi:3-oxoacyl-[acyl-carrier-protein] synthase-3
MIQDIASYLPETILSNEAIAALFPQQWSAEKIFQKTGIRQRHIAADGESVVDMAEVASLRLRARSENFAPDFILFCTQSPDRPLASSACQLQHRLELSMSTGALDLDSGCAGYIHGLAVAAGLLQAGISQQLLFVTSELYSRRLHPDDPSCRTIFGDGATATLLTIDDSSAKSSNPPRLSHFAFGSDGGGQRHLAIPGPDCPGDWQFGPGHLHMNGPEVFAFTIAHVPQTVQRVLDAAECNLEDIDYFVFHQANAFMLEHLRKKLAIPQEKFVLHLEHSGNTVSNTIPMALESCIAQHVFKDGMKIMLVGFGVGLSWGGCILLWRSATI